MRGHELHGGARARVYTALVACLLWLVGVEAMPAMHAAMHARIGAHRHDGAAIILLDAHGRDADVLALEDDADEPPPHHADAAHARLGRPLPHGAGSLAHRELAIHAPAPALHAPLPVDRRPQSLVAASAVTPASAAVPTAAARGPPA